MCPPMRSAEPVAPQTQLVLVTPVIEAADAFASILDAALSGGPVTAVIARFPAGDERGLVNAVKVLAPVVQARGTALVVDAPPAIAARGGADGCHLVFDERLLAEAVASLAPQRMVGVAGLKSRDDAMLAGERGADYVMFGEPMLSRYAERNGQLPPFHAVLERVGWWAELFEVPVVGFAPDLEGAAALAGVNADFVALGEPVWANPEGPAAGVREALAALARGRGP
jgi:thiamine-phosphate pyrophosphorylase